MLPTENIPLKFWTRKPRTSAPTRLRAESQLFDLGWLELLSTVISHRRPPSRWRARVRFAALSRKSFRINPSCWLEDTLPRFQKERCKRKRLILPVTAKVRSRFTNYCRRSSRARQRILLTLKVSYGVSAEKFVRRRRHP